MAFDTGVLGILAFPTPTSFVNGEAQAPQRVWGPTPSSRLSLWAQTAGGAAGLAGWELTRRALSQVCRKIQDTVKKVCLPWGPRPAWGVAGWEGSAVPPVTPLHPEATPAATLGLVSPEGPQVTTVFPDHSGGWNGFLCMALCEGPIHWPPPSTHGRVQPTLPLASYSVELLSPLWGAYPPSVPLRSHSPHPSPAPPGPTPRQRVVALAATWALKGV